MNRYLIDGPITARKIASEIETLGKRKDTGGHSIFLGQVRNDLSEGRKVKAIEYSAYEKMINSEAEKIKDAIFNEFTDVQEIVILHSVGSVKAGEISMFIMVSSGHRDHATRACKELVELIKKKLPVWKKEVYEDDTHIWSGNT